MAHLHHIEAPKWSQLMISDTVKERGRGITNDEHNKFEK